MKSYRIVEIHLLYTGSYKVHRLKIENSPIVFWLTKHDQQLYEIYWSTNEHWTNDVKLEIVLQSHSVMPGSNNSCCKRLKSTCCVLKLTKSSV